MVVWTAGYPGRGVRTLVEHAANLGARIRIWADLEERPGAFLAETLHTLLTSDSWVEQECFLALGTQNPAAAS